MVSQTIDITEYFMYWQGTCNLSYPSFPSTHYIQYHHNVIYNHLICLAILCK